MAGATDTTDKDQEIEKLRSQIAELESGGEPEDPRPIRAFELDPHRRGLLVARLSSYSDQTALQLIEMLNRLLPPIYADESPQPKPNRQKRRANASNRGRKKQRSKK